MGLDPNPPGAVRKTEIYRSKIILQRAENQSVLSRFSNSGGVL